MNTKPADQHERQQARYQARVRIIKALAHPARLMIVDELAKHEERCVCELTELVGSDMSTVSRHLAQLRAAGVVSDQKRGKMIYYRLQVACLPRFFECIDAVIENNLVVHQRLLG